MSRGGSIKAPRCIIIAGPNGAGKQGGHDVPRADVLRRFARGWLNFQRHYCPLADAWAVYDNSGATPRLIEQGP